MNVNEGKKKDKKIAFSPPDITEKEINAVVRILRSGWITTGPETKKFERNIAAYCHTEKAVCLNSATACMELTLRLLGIGKGDQVITTAYTYTATASAVCHTGAELVLVDTQKDSYEMDYHKLYDAITEKTKVIIPVDLAGVMCDYETIYQIIEEKKSIFLPSGPIQKLYGRIIVMADAAHSFGALQKRSENGIQRSGEAADFTCFSFHAVKNLTTAEGGAVTWKKQKGLDSERLYKSYMLLSLHGQTKDALAKTKMGAWEYDIKAPYYKCNMTDLSAAIGNSQLERYEEILEKRRRYIRLYQQAIEEWKKQYQSELSVLEHETKKYQSSGHLFMVRLTGKDSKYRNQLIERMAERGIAANVHYKPLPLLTAYRNLGYQAREFPNACALFENEITLPLHTCMTEEDAWYVIENFLEMIRENEMEKLGRTSRSFSMQRDCAVLSSPKEKKDTNHLQTVSGQSIGGSLTCYDKSNNGGNCPWN